VKSAVINNQDFLSNTVITPDNVQVVSECVRHTANDSEPCVPVSKKSIFKLDGANELPKQYQNAKKTPWILSILTILVGAGIVFLSSTWRKGLRHIGINLLIIGLVMLVFSWALNQAVTKKIVPKIKVDNAIFQQDIRNLVTDLAQQIDKN